MREVVSVEVGPFGIVRAKRCGGLEVMDDQHCNVPFVLCYEGIYAAKLNGKLPRPKIIRQRAEGRYDERDDEKATFARVACDASSVAIRAKLPEVRTAPLASATINLLHAGVPLYSST